MSPCSIATRRHGPGRARRCGSGGSAARPRALHHHLRVCLQRDLLLVDNLNAALEIAARHGCPALRGVGHCGDVVKFRYLRDPSGIVVMLGEEMNR